MPSPLKKREMCQMMKQQKRPTGMVKGQSMVKIDELLIEEILKAAGLEALD
jgi:hypothetical protein